MASEMMRSEIMTCVVLHECFSRQKIEGILLMSIIIMPTFFYLHMHASVLTSEIALTQRNVT